MNSTYHNGPGLKVPPPVFYIFSITGSIGMERFYPTGYLPATPSFYSGVVAAIMASILIVMVMRKFKQAATPFDVRQGASALVTDGVMNYSRNPGYLALTLFYIAIGLMLNNAWILFLTLPLILMMNIRVIRREEMHLEQVFGEEFRRYKQRVRRWI